MQKEEALHPKREILYCDTCNIYTMSATCSICHSVTHTRKPAKFSPADAYAKYRRMAKRGHNE